MKTIIDILQTLLIYVTTVVLVIVVWAFIFGGIVRLVQ